MQTNKNNTKEKLKYVIVSFYNEKFDLVATTSSAPEAFEILKQDFLNFHKNNCSNEEYEIVKHLVLQKETKGYDIDGAEFCDGSFIDISNLGTAHGSDKQRLLCNWSIFFVPQDSDYALFDFFGGVIHLILSGTSQEVRNCLNEDYNDFVNCSDELNEDQEDYCLDKCIYGTNDKDEICYWQNIKLS